MCKEILKKLKPERRILLCQELVVSVVVDVHRRPSLEELNKPILQPQYDHSSLTNEQVQEKEDLWKEERKRMRDQKKKNKNLLSKTKQFNEIWNAQNYEFNEKEISERAQTLRWPEDKGNLVNSVEYKSEWLNRLERFQEGIDVRIDEMDQYDKYINKQRKDQKKRKDQQNTAKCSSTDEDLTKIRSLILKRDTFALNQEEPSDL